MTTELEPVLKHWLQSEDTPENFYELFGLELLDPNLERIQALVDFAGEFFYHYQNNHKDKTVRARALILGRLVAEARRLLRSPTKLKGFEHQLVFRLWEQTWNQFLEQFSRSRLDEVTGLCQGEIEFTGLIPEQETLHDAPETVYTQLPQPQLRNAPFDADDARSGQMAWATHLGFPRIWTNSVGMKMVAIPPGSFEMGSPRDEFEREDDEGPVHVSLSQPFFLGQYVVTQQQWHEIMGTSPWENHSNVRNGAAYPAVNIDWFGATVFCQKLLMRDQAQGLDHKGWKYTLPTEAQWEFACRAGTQSAYSFGDDANVIDEFAWFYENAYEAGKAYAHPVGQKRPNAFSLYDMHGNIWEWCKDWYDKNLLSGTDPEATEKSTARVYRGGSWQHSARSSRSAYRGGFSPDLQEPFLGFRVAAVSFDDYTPRGEK